MLREANDQEIVAVLTEKIGAAPVNIEYDEAGNLLFLSLSQMDLLQVPA